MDYGRHHFVRVSNISARQLVGLTHASTEFGLSAPTGHASGTQPCRAVLVGLASPLTSRHQRCRPGVPGVTADVPASPLASRHQRCRPGITAGVPGVTAGVPASPASPLTSPASPLTSPASPLSSRASRRVRQRGATPRHAARCRRRRSSHAIWCAGRAVHRRVRAGGGRTGGGGGGGGGGPTHPWPGCDAPVNQHRHAARHGEAPNGTSAAPATEGRRQATEAGGASRKTRPQHRR